MKNDELEKILTQFWQAYLAELPGLCPKLAFFVYDRFSHILIIYK